MTCEYIIYFKHYIDNKYKGKRSLLLTQEQYDFYIDCSYFSQSEYIGGPLHKFFHHSTTRLETVDFPEYQTLKEKINSKPTANKLLGVIEWAIWVSMDNDQSELLLS